MIGNTAAQYVFYFIALIVLGIPLGQYMARVYEGEARLAQRVLGPLERLIYRVCGVRADEDMHWKRYAAAMILFQVFGFLLVYALQRLQAHLPLNPDEMAAVPPEVSFNTAVSFVTNTNWQTYGGESTLSYLTQMLGLTVQNFVSAATGMAVLVALIRGFTSLLLVSQGVVQTFRGHASAQLMESTVDADKKDVVEQTIALGPAASQIAIKQLGTNGGGFFNVNSAHPFENATPFSNFLEMLALLLIPAGLCFTFGAMVRDKRQGRAVIAAMLVLFVPLLVLCAASEQVGNPLFDQLGVDRSASALQAGGNMEGKEVRYGIADSALWAAATTAASNGSVNAMHDSFTPLGGLVPMWLIQYGEVIFGGVGSGLYGLLMYAIVAVFVSGLMVGRTPEYLGKKIESFEMKMAALVILLSCAPMLIGTAIACVLPAGTKPLGNPGAHGFSEILYAFSSGAGNNGSAFGGLTVNGMFYATAIGLAMLIGRYWLIVPVLAIAGSLASKKAVPTTAGTLPTHTPLFVVLLAGTVVLVGALTFFPALALGPIVEHFTLHGQ
jgi:K+-transporting ATPase ATPase A chain